MAFAVERENDRSFPNRKTKEKGRFAVPAMANQCGDQRRILPESLPNPGSEAEHTF